YYLFTTNTQYPIPDTCFYPFLTRTSGVGIINQSAEPQAMSIVQLRLGGQLFPMFEILVEEKFDAAHCLRGYPGNCERLHGHTYKVQVILRTSKLDNLGMAVDFRTVKAALRDILQTFDHSYMN